MSHAATTTPYVRLYTYSQYESHPTVPDWALAAFAVVMFIVITAVWVMISSNSEWAGMAYVAAIIVLLVSVSICCIVTSKSPERNGDVVDDNIALIEKSYRIRNIQPETPNPDDGPGDDSVKRFVGTDSNGKSIRMAVTAESETGDGLLHLTLQKDPDNLVRAYEGTGDTQHLITPATAVTVKQGGAQ